MYDGDDSLSLTVGSVVDLEVVSSAFIEPEALCSEAAVVLQPATENQCLTHKRGGFSLQIITKLSLL